MPVRKKDDVEFFQKLVRMLDSDREGERAAAFRQIHQQCADSGVLVWEAIVRAFREDTDTAAALREMQERLDQRESETALLAEKYMEAEERIQQLMGQRDVRERPYYFWRLVERAWSFPQSRLLLLSVVIVARCFIYCHWNDAGTVVIFWMCNVVAAIFGILLFCEWSYLQFAEFGPLQLIVKWALFGCGSALSFYSFFAAWPWEYGFSISLWAGHALQWPLTAISIFISVGILTVSKLSNWLIEAIGKKLWESVPIQVLRGCF